MKKTKTDGLCGALLRTLLALVCFLTARYLLGLAMEVVLLRLASGLGDWLILAYSIGSLALTVLVAFPLFCLVLGTRPGTALSLLRRPHALGHGETGEYLRLSLGIAAAALLIEWSLLQTGQLNAAALAPRSPSAFLSAVLQSVLVMPVLEELMFRGVVLRRFLPYGARAGVLISTLAFAVGHLNPINFLLGLPTGVILGYAALRGDSLRQPVLIHIVTNLFGNIAAPLLLAKGGGSALLAAGFSLALLVSAAVVMGSRERRRRLFPADF